MGNVNYTEQFNNLKTGDKIRQCFAAFVVGRVFKGRDNLTTKIVATSRDGQNVTLDATDADLIEMES